MSIVWAIVVGLIVGLIARAVLPGRQNIPLWLTTVLGMVGALIGGALYNAFGGNGSSGIDWTYWIVVVLAAAVLIAIVSPMYNRSRGTTRL
ncbi:MAG: GlsB/YeaQ/YmgE family stress response rane protein [Frankiales bacterium]|nr:GlsB/YeaQ/YmgE family stress response rane protein [Frankiales bacterium]